MDDPVESLDDSRRTIKLHRRHARFQGAVASPRNITPPSEDSSPLMHKDLQQAFTRPGHNSLDKGDILQELSNSSMRRRKRPAEEQAKSPHTGVTRSLPGTNHVGALFNTQMSPDTQHNHLRPPPRTELRKPRRVPSRASLPRRSVSGDTPRYIEHLESNVASLQNQLQAFTSPSASKPMGAKLRTMKAETKLLRQELEDWEGRFDDRVKEQLERVETLNGNMRVRIKSLERDIAAKDQRSKELEFELEQKTSRLETSEEANYDLERRLEFMSALVASSPGKLDFQSESFKSPYRKPPKVQPFGTPRMSLRTSLVSPDRERMPQRRQTTDFSQESRPRRESEASNYGQSRDSGYSTESNADLVSDGTRPDMSERSPTRPVSWMREPTADYDQRNKPGRRGRRFYTGAAIQSLILPSTRQQDQFLTNTPTLRTPTPSSRSFLGPTCLDESLNDQDEHNVHHNTMRDEDDASSDHSSETQSCPADEPHASGGFGQRVVTEDNDSAYRTPVHIKSSRPVKSLFEELSRNGDACGSPHADDADTTAIKHLDSVSPLSQTDLVAAPGVVGVSKLQTSPITTSADDSVTLKALPAATSMTARLAAHPASTIRLRWHQLLAHITQSFSPYSRAAHQLFANTWDALALSKHVLEFRCWLIRVLVGRLRAKGMFMHLQRPSSRRAVSANPAGLGLGLGGIPADRAVSAIMEPEYRTESGLNGCFAAAVDDREDVMPPFPPPMNWARFTFTMVFAVGIAIRDGPASLFKSREVETRRGHNHFLSMQSSQYGSSSLYDSP